MEKGISSYALLTVISVCCLISCDGKEVVRTSGDEKSYSHQAWKLREDGAPVSEFIAMQEKAVEALRAGSSKEDPLEVLSQMGYFYNIAGDTRNGIAYLQEASDWLEEHPERAESEGAIQLYGDLGDLYMMLGLSEEAMRENTKAMNVSSRLGGRYMTDLFRFRASIFELMDRPDSVLACFDRGLHILAHSDVEGDAGVIRDALLSERADYIFEKGLWPDSVDSQVAVMENMRGSSQWDASAYSLTIGKGYLAQGRIKEGIAELEKGMDDYKRQGDVRGVAYYGLPTLMGAYAKYGRYDRVGALYPEYSAMMDSVANEEKLNAVIGADIRYKVSRLAEEKKLLELRHIVVSQRIMLGVVAALVAMTGLVVLMIFQRRKHRENNRRQSERIDMLLSEQIMLNTRIAELNEKIANSENTARLEGVVLSPNLLEKESEMVFRKSFNELYPKFLSDLRRNYPGLTSGNELICMLIYLGKSTEEMALALGISRDSVNKSRYRIRQRMGIPRETDLDAYIRREKGG